MKHIRNLILVLCLCLPLLCVSAEAVSGTSGDGLSWSLEDGVLTISGSGAMADYTFVNPPWSPYSDSIQQAVIDSRVTSIGEAAFMNHSELRSVTVGKDVLSVGDYAFRFCSSLESVTFLGSAPRMSPGVFVGTSASVYYPAEDASWTEDYFSAFGDNVSWCPIGQMPEEPDVITGQMGNIRWSLSKDGVLTVSGEGSMPFYRNSDGSISYDWYEYADQTVKLIVEEGVTQVGTLAFADFPKLETAELAGSVTTVGPEAFRGTPFLQTLLDEQGLAIYDGMLIDYCGSGTEVTIPAHVGGLTYGIFVNSPALKAIYAEADSAEFASVDGALYSKDLTQLLAVPGGRTETLTLPQNVRYIASYTCSKLSQIVFTGNAPQFGSRAFYANSPICLYPAGNDTWTEEILRGYDGTPLWLSYEQTSLGMTVYGTWGSNFSWSLDGAGHLRIWGTGEMENRFYTPVVGGTIVSDTVAVPPDWMYFCDRIRSAAIEPGVTSICNKAFWQCPNLKTVSIADSVTAIGFSAFYNCAALEEISIPDGVTSIGPWAFQYCASLKKVKFSESLTSIGDYCFSDCTALEEIILPEHLTELGSFAFEDCTSLIRVTLPKSLTQLSTGVFRNTPYWDSLKQGDFLIANGILVDYTGPGGAVVIPADVRIIDRYAFRDCGNLTSVQLPEGLLEIRDGAFQYTGLTGITLPKSLESVGDTAFGDCSRLTDVTLGNENTRFSGDSFANTPFLKSLADAQGFRILGASLLGYEGKDTTPAIPDGVKYIARWAFSGNTKLTAAVLPEGILELGSGAFQSCSALRTVNLPQSLQYLGDSVFRDCRSLEEIAVPGSITRIGTRCFLNCVKLASVSLSEGLVCIGYEAFNNCSALDGIRLPHTVTTIEYGAFQNCVSLTGLNMPDSVTEVGSAAFEDCHALKSVKLSSSLTQISASCFSFCSLLDSVSVPDSVTVIGEYAFFGCEAMDEITFGTGLRQIRSKAFAECIGLDKLVFAGDAPRMNYPDVENQVTTFEGVRATAVYPAGNSTWTEDILQSFGGSLTWESSGCKAHDWQEADCETPKTCSACGKTEGEALDHDWKAATCDHPKACGRCGKTDGKPLEHRYDEGICILCGAEDPDAVVWGDANGDKIVDYMDAMLVLRHAVKLATLSEEAQKLCNVDGKGEIDYMDAMMILRRAVKLIDKFPIESTV